MSCSVLQEYTVTSVKHVPCTQGPSATNWAALFTHCSPCTPVHKGLLQSENISILLSIIITLYPGKVRLPVCEIYIFNSYLNSSFILQTE